MENNSKPANQEHEIILSKKEKMMEIAATAMCAILLIASFMKVIFF